jgi:hypothetical protein
VLYESGAVSIFGADTNSLLMNHLPNECSAVIETSEDQKRGVNINQRGEELWDL